MACVVPLFGFQPNDLDMKGVQKDYIKQSIIGKKYCIKA